MRYNNFHSRGRVPACAALALLAVLIASVSHAADYRVDPTGAGGAFTTIQAALNAVSGQSAQNRANLLLAPGVYHEQLEVTKPYVSFVGQGASPEDVAIVAGGQGIGDPGVYVKGQATGFMAANLTFENPLPDNVSQGLAIRSSADQSAFQRVRFLGYQDTILVDNNSRQYFQDVFITGDTDFIFGNATAVFDRSTIQSTDGGYITAASTERYTANGLVFLDCTLIKGTARTGTPPSTVNAGEVYYGRPWQWDRGKSSSTIFVRTRMDAHIRSEGWNDWGSPTPDDASRYSEFGSANLNGEEFALGRTGVPLGRENWADPMTADQAANFTIEKLFGPVAFWNQNPDAQPEFTGPYTTHASSAAWNPLADLAKLPGVLLGDFNDDGTVDAADYAVWRSGLGTGAYLANSTASPLQVDGADYALWRENYGRSNALSAAQPTPEPQAVALGGLTGLAVIWLGARHEMLRQAAVERSRIYCTDQNAAGVDGYLGREFKAVR